MAGIVSLMGVVSVQGAAAAAVIFEIELVWHL